MTDLPQDHDSLYYQEHFRFGKKSKWMETIWKAAMGEEYPGNLDAYGYVTQSELQEMGRRLGLEQDAIVLDVGCGKGGPGLKLAEQQGFRLVGIDPVEEAIRFAETFQDEFDLHHRARFQTGHFYQIPLPEASMEGVVSFDALWMVPNKIQALMEVRRVMKPGAQFVFTTWDHLAIDPVKILEISGLRVVHREESRGWMERQLAVYEGIRKYEAELKEELGPAAKMLLYEAESVPPVIDKSVRRLYHMA